MTVENFTWNRSGVQYGMSLSTNEPGEVWHATRGDWIAGTIKIIGQAGATRYQIEPGFPAGHSTPLHGSGDIDLAKYMFERAFSEFMSRAQLRPTHAPMKIRWVEQNDRHYGIANNILLFIVHRKDEFWLIDDFLPFTFVSGDYVKAMEAAGEDTLGQFDSTDKRTGGLRDINFGKQTVAEAQNQAEILLYGWLAQSAFMFRPDADSLPIGPQQ